MSGFLVVLYDVDGSSGIGFCISRLVKSCRCISARIVHGVDPLRIPEVDISAQAWHLHPDTYNI